VNEIPALWSLPWHELQRRLASSTSVPSLRERTAVSPVAVASQNVSWIVRARLGTGAGRTVKAPVVAPAR
jgi:hypothetical protein